LSGDDADAGTESRWPGVTVEDIRYRGPDDIDVEAFLVRPIGRLGHSPGPGVLMWHWLDTRAPDGNRTQFLDEASELATEGVVSLLPQGRFPWSVAPSGATADRREIKAEVARLRAGLELLRERADVDRNRLAIVGHDFGGMLATLAAPDVDGIRALVAVAATPRWGDWFLPFWEISDDRIDYLAALRSLDPIERIGDVSARTLLQFGNQDFYIALMSGRELHGVAREGTEWREYAADHEMRQPEIRADRLAFLRRELGLMPATGAGSASQAATT
jgi:dipeptidyl aminopeptidase/acylaminoacyl peptidase